MPPYGYWRLETRDYANPRIPVYIILSLIIIISNLKVLKEAANAGQQYTLTYTMYSKLVTI